MSYTDEYGICVNNGDEVYMNMTTSLTDNVACPPDITCISRATLTKLYEALATKLSKAPADVTEAELFAEHGFIDTRTP